jgi:hypothetical protein
MSTSTNIALLEHINLNVAIEDGALARAFYVERLGFYEDPRVMVMGKTGRLIWADAGPTQFHLPLVAPGTIDKAPQVLRGTIGLAVSNLDAWRSSSSPSSSSSSSSSPPSSSSSPNSVSLTCPFGNKFSVTECPSFAEGAAARCRGHPRAPLDASAPPGLLGIQSLTLDLPAGALAAVAEFWEGTLGARVTRRAGGGKEEEEEGEGAEASGASIIRVHIGSEGLVEQYIDFVESPSSSPVPAWDGHHLCIYLHDFEAAYRRCEARGILYDPGRFSDRGGSWSLALDFQQFRVAHVPRCGATLAHLGLLQLVPEDSSESERPAYSLELEIRSLQHPACPLAPKDAGAPGEWDPLKGR